MEHEATERVRGGEEREEEAGLRRATILDGKALARRLRKAQRARAQALVARGVTPSLVVILVGEDPASQVYVRTKERTAARAGIRSVIRRLPADTSEGRLLDELARWNQDPTVHGILVQLPLPPHLDPQRVVEALDPAKDVDGFHPHNVGRLILGQPALVPCTPKGILRLLDAHDVPLEGRRAVVVGRSNIVGKPMAALLLARNATVTVCHSRTRDLAAEVARADVVIAAAGRAGLVRGDWIRPGAAVVDVGIHRLEDGRLVGDVAFEEAAARAGWLSPVPGGVGPMTVSMLMENTLEAAEAAAAREHFPA